MITKTKERIRKTTQQARKRIRNRIEQVKMRMSHLLIKTVWRQLRKSQQPAAWLKAQARKGLRCLRSWARTVWEKALRPGAEQPLLRHRPGGDDHHPGRARHS
jgi:hypothetical protein